MKALVVEDNVLLGKSIKRGLEEAGWTVDLAPDGEEGIYFAESSEYDVILLDWMLPKLSGIEFLKSLRSQKNSAPTIMITAKGAVMDRVEGLERGADDYIVKPFEMVELIARVKALYRRSVGVGISTLTIGGLTFDLSGQVVMLRESKLDLTGKEYDLLAALATKSGHVVKRNTLASLLYNLDGEPESNSLDVLLARVRRKIVGAGVEIETLRGKGFVLRVATPSA